ncbi:MAG: ATP-binding protein [Sulfuricella sp.]|nr:ATP-binding protein [Sulfuricella sp.]
MDDKKLLALFGLKWNPFQADLPVDSLWLPPAMDSFFFRLENLVIDGGFALISGEPGLGKSKCLQLITHRLRRLDDVVVGVMERPQSNLGDFYREMGDIFGVNLSPANRYGGFKSLRERWQKHTQNTLFQPVLLIDEAQEMLTVCLNELRLLGSANFDSQCLLTTVLCGDTRLPERFRAEALVALGSRIKLRLTFEAYDRTILLEYLEHSLAKAGALHLMTEGLMETLVDHAAGNLRVLNNMAAELLISGAQKELNQLDEKLFLEVFSRQQPLEKRKTRQRLPS